MEKPDNPYLGQASKVNVTDTGHVDSMCPEATARTAPCGLPPKHTTQSEPEGKKIPIKGHSTKELHSPSRNRARRGRRCSSPRGCVCQDRGEQGHGHEAPWEGPRGCRSRAGAEQGVWRQVSSTGGAGAGRGRGRPPRGARWTGPGSVEATVERGKVARARRAVGRSEMCVGTGTDWPRPRANEGDEISRPALQVCWRPSDLSPDGGQSWGPGATARPSLQRAEHSPGLPQRPARLWLRCSLSGKHSAIKIMPNHASSPTAHVKSSISTANGAFRRLH